MNFQEKVSDIQARLKAPKSQFNAFGKYRYRNLEDILEAVKPLLNEHGLVLTIQDFPECVGERVYIKSEASLTDGENTITRCAYAREALSKKGMDESQVTGAASSYARKYCLNGLFLIDDTKDADSGQVTIEEQVAACESVNSLTILYKALNKTEQNTHKELFSVKKESLEPKGE